MAAPAVKGPFRVWRARGKESPSLGGEVFALQSLVGVIRRRGDQACWLLCTLAGQFHGEEVSTELWRWDTRQYWEALDRG